MRVMRDVHQLARLAGTLSEEIRLQILLELLKGEATVTELASRLGVAQLRVSSLLSVLRGAGLIDVDVVGRQRICRVERSRIEPLLATFPRTRCDLHQRA